MTAINAAVLEEVGKPFAIRDLELEEPRRSEVLVRMTAVGICHTDLAVQSGDLPVSPPMVLGHEGCGVVEAVGEDVAGIAVGEQVVLSPASCGSCRNCLTGKPVYCAQFMALNFGGLRPDGTSCYQSDGVPIGCRFCGQSSFATHSLVDARVVVKAPAALPPAVAASMACGIQTGAGSVLNTLKVEAGSSLVVFGAGPVGLSAVVAAHLSGCAVIVAVEPLATRRQLAVELGATHVIDPGQSDVMGALLDIGDGGSFDYSIETSGVPAVAQQAVSCLGSTGECALVGVPPAGGKVELDILSLIASGVTVRGVLFGDAIARVFLPRLAALYADGRFPIDSLITELPFESINEACEMSRNGDVVKAVLTLT